VWRAARSARSRSRQDRHARVGAGVVQHLFARRLHRRHALGSLQARLFGLLRQFLGRARGLRRHLGLRLDLGAGAAPRVFLGAGTRLERHAGLGFLLHPGAQFGGLLADRLQALAGRLGRGAQGSQPVALGGDGFFRGLRIGQRGGGGGRIHGGALLGQRAGARLGVGAALGRHVGLGLRFHPCDRRLDVAHFHRAARGPSLHLTQVDREVGRLVLVAGVGFGLDGFHDRSRWRTQLASCRLSGNSRARGTPNWAAKHCLFLAAPG